LQIIKSTRNNMQLYRKM